MSYGTSGGYSKLGVNYSGQVSGELTSGFDLLNTTRNMAFWLKIQTVTL